MKKSTFLMLLLLVAVFVAVNIANRRENVLPQTTTRDTVLRQQEALEAKANDVTEVDCGNISTFPSDDFSQMMKALVSGNSRYEKIFRCYRLEARRISVGLGNAGPLLQFSSCYDSLGDYVFEAPSLLYLTVCDKVGCKVYVFMEEFPGLIDLAYSPPYSSSPPSLQRRDEVLLDICPPGFGQVRLAQRDSWRLIPMEADLGTIGIYEEVFAGLIGGRRGVHYSRFGLAGIRVIEEVFGTKK